MNPMFGLMMNMGMRCLASPFMMGMNFMMPSLFCGCSNFMTMPYYRDDRFSFMNSPVYRDTSYDFLLDPNFALKQCQMQWQNGGLFGMTNLPGFNFPQFAPVDMFTPSANSANNTNSANQGANGNSSGAGANGQNVSSKDKKVQKLYDVCTKLIKLAENKANFIDLPEDFEAKIAEAMKKETAEEQTAALKEVMSLIPAETLRKTVLADEENQKLLRSAGYCFGFANNKYSFNDSDEEKKYSNYINVAKLESDIKTNDPSKKFEELQKVAGQVSAKEDQRERILGIISTWNDTHHTNSDRGIIRLAASYIPDANTQPGGYQALYGSILILCQALSEKALEYSGCEKITKAKEKLDTELGVVTTSFTKSNLLKLADAFDELYVRLRMQEAVNARDVIKKQYGFLNEVKENIISDKTILEETEKDLEKEGLTPVSVDDLDRAVISQEQQTQERILCRDIDRECNGDGQKIIDALVLNGEITPVAGQDNVYAAKTILSNANPETGYYILKDNKIYPARKIETLHIDRDNNRTETVEFKALKTDVEINADYIYTANMTAERVQNLVETNVLKPAPAISSNSRQFYKSTGKTDGKYDYYLLKNGKLYHVINVKETKHEDPNNRFSKWVMTFEDGRTVNVNEIPESDLEEMDVSEDSSIKTKKQEIDEQNKEIVAVEEEIFESLSDLDDNEVLDRISEKICGEKKKFEKCKDMRGVFIAKAPKTAIYLYDSETKQLKHIRAGVLLDLAQGYYIDHDFELKRIAEQFMENQIKGEELMNKDSSTLDAAVNGIRDYGKQFAKLVYDSNAHASAELVKLNTIMAMNDPLYTINFIKGFKASGPNISKNMFRSIFEYGGLEEDYDGENLFNIAVYKGQLKASTENYDENLHKMFDLYIKEASKLKNFYIKFSQLLLNAADKFGMDRNDDNYKLLERFANANFSYLGGPEGNYSNEQIADILDDATNKVIEAYDEYYNKK